MRLQKSFFSTSTTTLAKSLIGTVLVHKTQEGIAAGRIVETEAYLFKNDPACHAARGKTKRNEPMFGPPGRSYIYFIYGMYHCFNVVSGKEGEGEAVLIRALEPVEGIELMQARRNKEKLADLCSVPAKLVLALGITPEQNNQSLLRGPLSLKESKRRVSQNDIVTTTRIGIKEGSELPLRFYLKDSPYVSRR